MDLPKLIVVQASGISAPEELRLALERTGDLVAWTTARDELPTTDIKACIDVHGMAAKETAALLRRLQRSVVEAIRCEHRGARHPANIEVRLTTA